MSYVRIDQTFNNNTHIILNALPSSSAPSTFYRRVESLAEAAKTPFPSSGLPFGNLGYLNTSLIFSRYLHTLHFHKGWHLLFLPFLNLHSPFLPHVAPSCRSFRSVLEWADNCRVPTRGCGWPSPLKSHFSRLIRSRNVEITTTAIIHVQGISSHLGSNRKSSSPPWVVNSG